jgi:hypothetical protein
MEQLMSSTDILPEVLELVLAIRRGLPVDNEPSTLAAQEWEHHHYGRQGSGESRGVKFAGLLGDLPEGREGPDLALRCGERIAPVEKALRAVCAILDGCGPDEHPRFRKFLQQLLETRLYRWRWDRRTPYRVGPDWTANAPGHPTVFRVQLGTVPGWLLAELLRAAGMPAELLAALLRPVAAEGHAQNPIPPDTPDGIDATPDGVDPETLAALDQVMRREDPASAAEEELECWPEVMSAGDIAKRLRLETNPVEVFLRRYRKEYSDCVVVVEPEDRRRNAARYLYRTADVLPHLRAHFRLPVGADGIRPS